MLALLLGACSGQKPTSTLPSSAGQPRYALEHPAAMHRVQNELDDRERAAREVITKFADYPTQLPTEHHPLAREILVIAADEGRSQDYVRAAYETELVERYFDEEKDVFQTKVGGAAQYSAKQAGCKGDVASPTLHALKKTVEKTLEDRLDSHSEAQRRIDENEKTLGAEATPKLREQARAVSRASYLTYVAAPLAKATLEAKLAEAEEVGKTLDSAEKTYTSRSEDTKLDESERKRSQELAIEAREAKRVLATEVEAAKERLKTAEERLKKLQEEHQAALDQLLAALASKS